MTEPPLLACNEGPQGATDVTRDVEVDAIRFLQELVSHGLLQWKGQKTSPSSFGEVSLLDVVGPRKGLLYAAPDLVLRDCPLFGPVAWSHLTLAFYRRGTPQCPFGGVSEWTILVLHICITSSS